MDKLLTLLKLCRRKKYDSLVEALRVRASEVSDLNRKLIELQAREATRVPIPVVRVDSEDPDKVSGPDRKAHVARIAGFHFDIMDRKLKHTIEKTREVLMSVGRDTYGYSQEQFDIYLKGTENAFWLIWEWGESARNEVIADQTGETELTDEELDDLKDKVKQS